MLNRLIFLIHRWTGVVLALFMLLWFASGLVIMYSSSINLSRDQQLAHAEPLRLEQGWLSFGEAWKRSAGERAAGQSDKNGKTGSDEIGIVEARLSRQGGQPLWLVEDTRERRYAVSALDGHLWRATPEDALKIAATWLVRDGQEKTARDLQYVGIQEKGSSILRGQDALAPFHRVSLQNALGGEVIVSAVNGEVIQVSNALERGAYWAGNWLHLFRFFDSAGWGSVRNDVLLWIIAISLAACITGLIVGWLRWRPGWGGKPTYKEGRVHPYRVFWFRWHFWAGLIGGVVATLWAFSGIVNALQGKLFSPAAPTRDAMVRYYGTGIPEKIRDWQPSLTLSDALPDADEVVQLAWRRLGDDAILLASKTNGERITIDSTGFSETKLTAAIKRLTNSDASVKTQAALITEYDSHYYLRHRRD
ncbi:MAG: PepSY domain-containing protein, partial [Zoogloeaceae bacterium]|nr:PepSY domain-containing protein [Zoogloeaceae bacterium]